MVARDGCARSTMRIRVEAANVPKKNASSLGRALALSLSPRFAEWAFMEPWKEGAATELLGGAVNAHSVTMPMRESAKYAVAAGHIHP
jgi:hypothetical protein